MKINAIYLLEGTKMKVSEQKLMMQEFWESNKQKLFGVHIDYSFERKISFDEHISRLSGYITLTQRRVLMKSFIETQFGYCPLVWLFHGRVLNRKINHLHEPSLRIVYKDSISSFHVLLQKDHFFTIHYRALKSLAIELHEIKEILSNEIMSSIFLPRLIKYNLRT